ncbi:MAG TPA: tetratricopeptide repeat protein [Gemmataceae bacterium]|nr:tetratricopeptide repeat protein [Gemmataceae bacterium]
MSRLVSSSLAGVALLVGLSPLNAQSPSDIDPPTRHAPVKSATRQELDHLQAVKLYGLGAIQESQNRLIEAMHTFEEARRLDPESAAIPRTLIPLYLALDRLDDALASCRRVLELDPGDYETGHRYARQLRALGKTKDAMTVLTRAAVSPRLKERLELRAQIFHDLSQMQEEAGELDKAEKSLREVLAVLDEPTALLEQGSYNREEIAAQAADTYEHLGRLYLKGKHTDQAIEAFQKSLKKDPARSARLSFNLAEVYAGQGEAGKALAEVEQYLRSQPQGMEGYELRIKLQKELGRSANILQSLERSATADQNNITLQLLLAREYRKAARSPRAEEIYKKLLKTSPTTDVYRGLFRLYQEGGQQGAANLLARLDDALGKATEDTEKEGMPATGAEERREAGQRAAVHARAMLSVLRDDTELVKFLMPAAQRRLLSPVGLKYATRVMLANLAARTRELAAAEALYRSCLARAGAAAARQGKEQEIYSGLLTVLALAHKNEAIIELCAEGLKAGKTIHRGLFYRALAQAHMALGHVRESLAAADEAVNMAAASDSALLHCRLLRVELFSQADKHEQAIAECQELLKDYNQPGDVHTIRSVFSAICSAAHQHDKAEEQLLLILKDDPDDATANNDLGYLWADQNKKLDEAEKRIRRALELDRRQRKSNKSTRVSLDGDRDNAAYVDSLGWVLFRKGDWTGARRELEKARSLPTGEDDPAVWDHLGDVYFRLKENAKAQQAWKKAVELYESGGRRRPDERYREIKEKLRHGP